ncbi:MAG: cell division protein FtsZ [Bacteroidales bacterium]|nr:cell division protein FtsZ [Bacteroidales bacterium]MDD4669870.1 cell division protein FtsZ [Bacteroidales bacterium]
MEAVKEVEQFGLPWDRKSNIIKVIGVGGGGSNAVSYMYSQEIKNVDFAICNTDMQALEMSPVPTKLQLGEIITKGLGAGTDPVKGKKAAKESIDSINKMLGDNTEMVFITCGMGGGTGTGAAPVIAEAAKKREMLTVGVVTIPFRDEGPEALYRAVEGIKEFDKFVDSLLIIDNQKLYEIFGDLDLFEAFPKADEVLATAVKSIAEIITCRGYINVDFADVRMVMKNSGMSIMGTGVASGPDRAIQAVEKAFSSPLLNECDLHTAKSVLVNITSSSESGKTIKTFELSQIMDYIKEYTGPTGNFKRGVVKNDALGENISVTIVATGFEMAQLPVISEDMIHHHNKIEVKYDKKYSESKKRGLPLCPERQSQIVAKSIITGKPALITDNPRTIKELKSEPAITRRERMFKEQQQEKEE